MEDYVEHMFYVPLVHIKIKNWKKKQKIIFDFIEKKENINFCTSVFTDYFNDCRASNEFIQELFDEELDLFLKKLDYGTKNIHSSWIEISKNKNNHPIHNHQGYGYSAVCYVQFDKSEHKPTIFVSPFLSFLNGDILEYSPQVDEGSIIFFPSAIMHYTSPNQSQKDRIILSFNIRD